MTDELDDGMDWTLLARYLSGEASEPERREVERWVAHDPARQEEVAVLRRLWEQAGALPAPARIDEMWSAVAREMSAPVEAPRRPMLLRPGRPRRVAPFGSPFLRPIAAVAASIMLALAGMAAYGELRQGDPSAAVDAPRVYRTERGHTARIQLSDGTRVVLGPDSRLSVAPFRGGVRDLELVGEAVFEVEHDAERPFVVRAAHAVTEDLGTEFGIRAYPGDPNVHVVVVEGRVALRADGAPAHSGTILEPGQMGRLDAVGRVAVESGTDPAAYLGWTDGRVVFAQTPLRDVVAELERWYDVDLQITDSAIAARRITLDMPAGSLYDVLDAVAVPLNIRYEKTRDTIRLYR